MLIVQKSVIASHGLLKVVARRVEGGCTHKKLRLRLLLDHTKSIGLAVR